IAGLSQIIVGAFLLSIVHASIPNHWIPLVALSKAEKWNEKLTMGITAIAGFAHTLSTIIIGIIVGFFGYKLSDSYSFIVGVIAPSLLILLGIIYLIYTIITIAGMLLLVWLGMKGVRKIKSHFLEHHEKTITGILLIVLGIAGYFIR